MALDSWVLKDRDTAISAKICSVISSKGVTERERERARVGESKCVCVKEREGERERDSTRARDTLPSKNKKIISFFFLRRQKRERVRATLCRALLPSKGKKKK